MSETVLADFLPAGDEMMIRQFAVPDYVRIISERYLMSSSDVQEAHLPIRQFHLTEISYPLFP